MSILPSILFIVNIIIQNFNLGKLVYVFTDEGVYLYAAKLLGQGFIPYKDFFLAQPPFLLYPVSFILSVTNFNLNLFHFLYTLWFFSAIFPLYFLILKITKSNLAAILSIILFSTFSELTQWDSHFFALRQASLPFLALSLYFIVKSQSKISGLLLGFFALSLISNFILSLCLIAALFLNRTTKNIFPFLLIFGSTVILGYLLIFLIPNSFNNIIAYQLERPIVPYLERFEWIKIYILNNNWPILLLGLTGSLLFKTEFRWIGFFNILSIISIIFIGASFYPHYITILAVGLTISSGILISYFTQSKVKKLFISSLILISIYFSSYNHLKLHLIDAKNPNFFQITKFLKQTPEPLFTFEPLYGLYAKRDLTFHYYVSDMRYFRVMGKNLNDSEYLNILIKSNTVLLEPFANSMLSAKNYEYIRTNFQLAYKDSLYEIYKRP